MMEIAAACVGFVSLSGQILQGCNHLCDFFSNAKDAPEVIVDISKELFNVRLQLESFQRLLLEIQTTSPASLRAYQDPLAPLQSCQDVMKKLQVFVDKHADLSISTATYASSSQRSGALIRKTWQKIDVARSGDKLRRHKLQLEAAKTSLLAVQNSIQLAFGIQHLSVTGEAKRSIQQLQREHLASAQETRALVTDIHNLQEDNRLLSQQTNLSMNRVVSDSEILLRQTALSERSAHDVKVASDRTQDAVASLSADLVKGFDGLQTMLGPLIERTIKESLDKHNASGKASVVSTRLTPNEMSTIVGKATTYNDNVGSLHKQERSERTQQQRESGSLKWRGDSSLVSARSTSRAVDLMQPAQLSRRGPKRQQTRRSIFNVWFGRIELTTSITEQEDMADSDYVPPMRLQARRIRFRLIPNLWFLKTGLFFESGSSRPTLPQPGWDNRLRVLRTHQADSPVHDVIRCGDYIRFRQMLERREITPFDLVHDVYDGLGSLSTAVVKEYALSYFEHTKRKELFDMVRLLADSEVDCNVYVMVLLMSMKSFYVETCSLVRIIMAQSQSDPFEGLCQIPEFLFEPETMRFLLLKQDEWDSFEFKTSFAKYWGNGSFQSLLENGPGKEEWHDSRLDQKSELRSWLKWQICLKRQICLMQQWQICLMRQICLKQQWQNRQKQKWRQMPASLRRSRSLCLAEFGTKFVEEIWPELCWIEERPVFWQSRQACEETFGGWFADRLWPDLYWKEELPSFWHSRKACLEYLGPRFLWEKWPDYLGKTCFEFLEGLGAWDHRSIYSEKAQEEWITKMVNGWLNDEVTLRHSRHHCISLYGTSFVQDKLPSLLREEGLPKEEILRLTAYGPDMEPPTPQCMKDRDRYGRVESGSAAEELDGEEESDGESDSELSSGWHTAEED